VQGLRKGRRSAIVVSRPGQGLSGGKKRTFQHSGALRQFLETVLWNRIRNRGARKTPDPLSSSYEPIDPSLDRNAHALEAKELVAAALCCLPERQQEICSLRGQGMSRLQISRELGCSRRTVDRALEHFAFVVQRLLNSEGQNPANQAVSN
jgi:RNA polymerase sigma factor (sigma-70 family)